MKTIYKDNIWRQIIHFVKEERWDGEYILFVNIDLAEE